jgi:hypothetical protein
MGEVYANSYLTISALSSENDAGGCFPGLGNRLEKPHVSADARFTGRRCIANATPLIDLKPEDGELVHTYRQFSLFGVSELPYEGQNSRIYTTVELMPSLTKGRPTTHLIGEFGGQVDPIRDEPLSQRAWTLQERLLSSRTLHYGAQKMYWECQTYVLAEDGAFLRKKFPSMKVLVEPKPSDPPVAPSDDEVLAKQDKLDSEAIQINWWQ